MTWAMLRDHAPVMPWEDGGEHGDWDAHWFSEQEFWQKLARTHGNLVAKRCCDRRFAEANADEQEWLDGRRPLELHQLFAECPEVAHEWLFATNEDERMRYRETWFDTLLLEREFLAETLTQGRFLLLVDRRMEPARRESYLRALYEIERYELRLRVAQGFRALELDAMEREREAAA